MEQRTGNCAEAHPRVTVKEDSLEKVHQPVKMKTGRFAAVHQHAAVEEKTGRRAGVHRHVAVEVRTGLFAEVRPGLLVKTGTHLFAEALLPVMGQPESLEEVHLQVKEKTELSAGAMMIHTGEMSGKMTA